MSTRPSRTAVRSAGSNAADAAIAGRTAPRPPPVSTLLQAREQRRNLVDVLRVQSARGGLHELREISPRRAGLTVLRELDAEVVERVEVRRLQGDRALPLHDRGLAIAPADRDHREPRVSLR